MPSCLGPKSPRVTNANHEIDNMHKFSSGLIGLFLNFSQSTNGFGNLDHTLTKRGFERVGKAKNMLEDQQNQHPPKVEAKGYL